MDSHIHHNTRADEEVEQGHDPLIERATDPLLGDRTPPASKQVNNTRLLLYAGPTLLLW
jgi:hypothetical protein